MGAPRRVLVALAGLFLTFALPACREQPPAPPDAGGAAAVVDAGPPQPVALEITVTGEPPDGGAPFEVPLSDGARPEVPQLQKLTVTTNLPLKDFRLRIFDEADRAMVSDDTSELIPDAGIRYQVVFPEPLKAGYRYALVMDAQTGPAMTDVAGNEHPDLRREFKIAGEREKPAPPPKQKRHRRR
ncbi:MAG: hypothetical protein IRZ16_06740 [Myxococcaceae bacterium]|nr:hypothetical protein [Myxococcaceae bacterium]